MLTVEKVGFNHPCEILYCIASEPIRETPPGPFGWFMARTYVYYLHKNGAIREYESYCRSTLPRTERTAYWASKKEAQKFLDNWPNNFPESYVEYVTKQMQK